MFVVGKITLNKNYSECKTILGLIFYERTISFYLLFNKMLVFVTTYAGHLTLCNILQSKKNCKSTNLINLIDSRITFLLGLAKFVPI